MGKLGADQDRLKEAVEKLKTLNSGTDRSAIQGAVDEVNKIWSELATQMYTEAKPEGDPAPEGTSTDDASNSSSKDDEIEDADFEVVDDDK